MVDDQTSKMFEILQGDSDLKCTVPSIYGSAQKLLCVSSIFLANEKD
jgi:hypothetical protein